MVAMATTKNTKNKKKNSKSGSNNKNRMPIPQKVRWNSGYKTGEPGVEVESELGVDFIPWKEVKKEIEEELFYHLGRVLGDAKYTAETGDFHGRKNHLLEIVDSNGQKVGSVWFGTDPYSGWKWDGKVRVGKRVEATDEHTHKVWQIFERYSDGSYRRVEALDTPEDRLYA